MGAGRVATLSLRKLPSVPVPLAMGCPEAVGLNERLLVQASATETMQGKSEAGQTHCARAKVAVKLEPDINEEPRPPILETGTRTRPWASL